MGRRHKLLRLSAGCEKACYLLEGIGLGEYRRCEWYSMEFEIGCRGCIGGAALCGYLIKSVKSEFNL